MRGPREHQYHRACIYSRLNFISLNTQNTANTENTQNCSNRNNKKRLLVSYLRELEKRNRATNFCLRKRMILYRIAAHRHRPDTRIPAIGVPSPALVRTRRRVENPTYQFLLVTPVWFASSKGAVYRAVAFASYRGGGRGGRENKF